MKRPSRTAPWRYYAAFYRGDHLTLLLGVGLALAQSALLVPIAPLVRYVFDRLLPARDLPRLIAVGAALVVCYLVGPGIALWSRTIINRIVKGAIARLRHELLLTIYALPRDEYLRTDLSVLHARLVQDTERLDAMTDQLLARVLPALVTAGVLVCGLLLLNPLFCLVLVVGGVPVALADRLMRRRALPYLRAARRASEAFSAGILFALRALDLTRAQTAEAFEQARQRDRIERLRSTGVAMNVGSAIWTTIQDANMALIGVAMLVVGGAAAMAGHLSIGGFLSAFVLTGLIRDQLRTCFAAIPPVLHGGAALATLHAFATAERCLPYDGTAQPHFDGCVALEGVTFGYGDRPVLRDADLVIGPRGAGVVALIGPSGAGKSTIVNLILGFHRPQHGRLRAAGRDYDDLDLAAIRRRIAVVPQDPLIFAGTVAENIAYGTPGATLEEIRRAAELAAADRFIDALPQGYDTPISQEGATLSGGQRQRLAIARALLRRPALLLLDEPTNHLDSDSVRRFMATLREAEDAPAILLISHDAAVVRGATSLYELREGRIVAVGQPAEVLAR